MGTGTIGARLEMLPSTFASLSAPRTSPRAGMQPVARPDGCWPPLPWAATKHNQRWLSKMSNLSKPLKRLLANLRHSSYPLRACECKNDLHCVLRVPHRDKLPKQNLMTKSLVHTIFLLFSTKWSLYTMCFNVVTLWQFQHAVPAAEVSRCFQHSFTSL